MVLMHILSYQILKIIEQKQKKLIGFYHINFLIFHKFSFKIMKFIHFFQLDLNWKQHISSNINQTQLKQKFMILHSLKSVINLTKIYLNF